MLTARLTPNFFALASAGVFFPAFSHSPIPMKQKLFAFSAGALLLAGSVLAAGTKPATTTRAAARKGCPVTKSCPASMCQPTAGASAACPPRPGCCMK